MFGAVGVMLATYFYRHSHRSSCLRLLFGEKFPMGTDGSIAMSFSDQHPSLGLVHPPRVGDDWQRRLVLQPDCCSPGPRYYLSVPFTGVLPMMRILTHVLCRLRLCRSHHLHVPSPSLFVPPHPVHSAHQSPLQSKYDFENMGAYLFAALLAFCVGPFAIAAQHRSADPSHVCR